MTPFSRALKYPLRYKRYLVVTIVCVLLGALCYGGGIGTIYPILSRLKREGLVRTTIRESSEGPARKYYELTAGGEAMLDKMNGYWQVIKSGSDAIIKENKP